MHVYSYEDANGEVRQTKERAWVDGKKRFFWHSRTETGWVDTEGDERYLYHLPEVLEAQRTGEDVYVCEGEKDADALRGVGCIATTPPDNGAWSEGLAAPLAGAGVWVCYDNDAAGHERGWWAVNALRAVGARLRGCLRALVGNDVADHLEAGHGVGELVEEDPPRAVPGAARRAYGGGEDEEAAITRLVGAAGRYGPRVAAVLRQYQRQVLEDIEWLTLEDIMNQPDPEWLVEQWFPLVGFATVFGSPGSTKTFLSEDVADAVVRGSKDGWNGYQVRQGAVMVLQGEGTTQLKPRIQALHMSRGQLNGNTPIWHTKQVWDLTSLDGLARLVQEVCKFEEACGQKVVLVAVDSVALYGASTNDQGVEHTEQFALAARALGLGLGLLVLAIQHTEATGQRARGTEHIRMWSEAHLKIEKVGSQGCGLYHASKNRYGAERAIRFEFTDYGPSIVLTPLRGAAGDDYLPEDFAREQRERKEEGKEKRAVGAANHPDNHAKLLAIIPQGEDEGVSQRWVRTQMKELHHWGTPKTVSVLDSMVEGGLVLGVRRAGGWSYWQA